jgi:hypothetical protein
MAKEKDDLFEELEKRQEKIVNKISKIVGIFLITFGTIFLIVFAWLLIIVGIAGLVLPIIPGILLIILGIYILKSKRVRRYSIKIIRIVKRKSRK